MLDAGVFAEEILQPFGRKGIIREGNPFKKRILLP